MPTYKRLKVAFESGSGAWLTDVNGERYLDALSGISVCSIGHANEQVSEALIQQAQKLTHTSNLYEIPLQENLAYRLCKLSGLDKVFFGNSGAEANEAAIKICRKYAQAKRIKKPVIIVMNGSFHGRTLATLTATGNPSVQEGYTPLLDGFHHIPYGDIDALSRMAASDQEIVAVMLEPILGEGGIVLPPTNYLQQVRDICTNNSWLMVLDEIQTGMCRTGEWFSWKHSDTKPDVMTLAKALGNSFPIGACLASDTAAEAMVAGSHGSTFGGNPLASRVALTVLDFMDENNLAQRAKLLGKEMFSQFQASLSDLEGVVDVRGVGLMLGIEMHKDCTELIGKALERHLLINVTAGNVIRLLPPLIIDDVESEQIVSTVCELIKEFLSQ